MAKRKSFKSLPKRAKRAAFASMSASGTLKAKGKSGRRTGAAGVAGMPKYLQPFGKMAASSKNAADFIEKTRAVQVSSSVSSGFSKKYMRGAAALDMYKAANNFIKASRRK